MSASSATPRPSPATLRNYFNQHQNWCIGRTFTVPPAFQAVPVVQLQFLHIPEICLLLAIQVTRSQPFQNPDTTWLFYNTALRDFFVCQWGTRPPTRASHHGDFITTPLAIPGTVPPPAIMTTTLNPAILTYTHFDPAHQSCKPISWVFLADMDQSVTARGLRLHLFVTVFAGTRSASLTVQSSTASLLRSHQELAPADLHPFAGTLRSYWNSHMADWQLAGLAWDRLIF